MLRVRLSYKLGVEGHAWRLIVLAVVGYPQQTGMSVGQLVTYRTGMFGSMTPRKLMLVNEREYPSCISHYATQKNGNDPD
jgi:hypothetical protein